MLQQELLPTSQLSWLCPFAALARVSWHFHQPLSTFPSHTSRAGLETQPWCRYSSGYLITKKGVHEGHSIMASLRSHCLVLCITPMPTLSTAFPTWRAVEVHSSPQPFILPQTYLHLIPVLILT